MTGGGSLSQNRRKWAIFFCMILVVYLGQGSFASGIIAVLFSSKISFWEDHVLSSQIEVPQEKKKWCTSIIERAKHMAQKMRP